MGLPVDATAATPPAAPPAAPPVAQRAVPRDWVLRQQHAFLDAAKAHDFARVRRMVSESPALVNAAPAGRWSALHQAAHAPDADTVRFLLDHGADVSVLTRDGRTARQLTTNPECMRLLDAATRRASLTFDLGELGVAADIPLRLLSYATTQGGRALRGAEAHETRYEVGGPAEALRLVEAVCGSEREARCGFITATARVTLAAAARADAGIPAEAAFFAFAHPPEGVGAKSAEDIDRLIRLSESAHHDAQCILHFLCLGGYLYFDHDHRLLSVNAITAPPAAACPSPEHMPDQLHAPARPSSRPVKRLAFGAACTLRTQAVAALNAEGRLHEVTFGMIRREGAVRYAWVHPSERPRGQGLSDEAHVSWEHGAFVYVDAWGDGIFFCVAAPEAEAEASAEAMAEVVPVPPLVARTHSQSMAEETGLSIEEVRASIAAEVTRIAHLG